MFVFLFLFNWDGNERMEMKEFMGIRNMSNFLFARISRNILNKKNKLYAFLANFYVSIYLYTYY